MLYDNIDYKLEIAGVKHVAYDIKVVHTESNLVPNRSVMAQYRSKINSRKKIFALKH